MITNKKCVIEAGHSVKGLSTIIISSKNYKMPGQYRLVFNFTDKQKFLKNDQ